eukprot:2263840-Alexandrium_andersonii.AAC.1
MRVQLDCCPMASSSWLKWGRKEVVLHDMMPRTSLAPHCAVVLQTSAWFPTRSVRTGASHLASLDAAGP